MEFNELVKRARSIRRFDGTRPLSYEQLFSLVSLCSYIPSGANAQPLRYKIVSDEEEKNSIFPSLHWAGALKDWDGPSPDERPGGYILILSEIKRNPNHDTGIAAQTIQLGAAAMGIGCCMMGAIERKDIVDVLQIPSTYDLHLVLSLGYPAESVVIDFTDTGSSLKYYRSDDGVHHVPKLHTENILI